MSIVETSYKGLDIRTSWIEQPYFARSSQFTSLQIDIFRYCMYIAHCQLKYNSTTTFIIKLFQSMHPCVQHFLLFPVLRTVISRTVVAVSCPLTKKCPPFEILFQCRRSAVWFWWLKVHRLAQHSGHDVKVLHPYGSVEWMDLHLKLYT